MLLSLCVGRPVLFKQQTCTYHKRQEIYVNVGLHKYAITCHTVLTGSIHADLGPFAEQQVLECGVICCINIMYNATPCRRLVCEKNMC
jgi:hypothetical protein